MPTAPITAKSAKPSKLVAASEPYAIDAPSDATAVGRSVPAIARGERVLDVVPSRRSSR